MINRPRSSGTRYVFTATIMGLKPVNVLSVNGVSPTDDARVRPSTTVALLPTLGMTGQGSPASK